MGSTVRFIIGVVLVLLLAVFGTIFLVRQFSRDAADATKEVTVIHPADFIDKQGSSVIWKQEGRVVGDEVRRSVRITVSATERKAELLTGYEEKVERSIVLPNDKEAYAKFMISLEHAGFGTERKVKQVDERGICPLGQTYIYEIIESSQSKLRLWSTSCTAKDGTFGGKTTTVRQLFQAQIPGYEKITSGVRF
jgi:hypothetical protein